MMGNVIGFAKDGGPPICNDGYNVCFISDASLPCWNPGPSNNPPTYVTINSDPGCYDILAAIVAEYQGSN